MEIGSIYFLRYESQDEMHSIKNSKKTGHNTLTNTGEKAHNLLLMQSLNTMGENPFLTRVYLKGISLSSGGGINSPNNGTISVTRPSIIF